VEKSSVRVKVRSSCLTLSMQSRRGGRVEGATGGQGHRAAGGMGGKEGPGRKRRGGSQSNKVKAFSCTAWDIS
jgi:hypothetical protein